jgi:hypothetical protein
MRKKGKISLSPFFGFSFGQQQQNTLLLQKIGSSLPSFSLGCVSKAGKKSSFSLTKQ